MNLLDNLPASVEMAAGSGKTWLLANTAGTIAAKGGRTLVLTHTVAGIHAIRSKMRELGTDSDSNHVATLTSFAIELVTAYPAHAGFEVPPVVDLSRSSEYIRGANSVLQRKHIREMMKISYTHVLVDEYQDCTLDQHELVCTLKAINSQIAVLGDRLQGIFGFAGPVVDWDIDVLPEFPAFSFEEVPHRWLGHNEDLGRWLLQLRPHLRAGEVLDLSKDLPEGVTYIGKTQSGVELVRTAHKQRDVGETVVVIAGPFSNSARAVAKRLRGFSFMEEMAGKFMHSRLEDLVISSPNEYASWLMDLAKRCFVGYSKLDKTVQGRLDKGKPVSTLKRPGLERTLVMLDRVLESPTFTTLSESMREISRAREANLHSREAWHDIVDVIGVCALNPDANVFDELQRLREQVRHGGRRSQYRVVSRTLLVKGLEYDHVIIADLSRITDACNLYVALSRARKSVTIIGPTPRITVAATSKGR